MRIKLIPALAIISVLAGCSTQEHRPTVFDDDIGRLEDRQARVHESYRTEATDDLRNIKFLENYSTPLVDRSMSHIPYVSGRSEPVRDQLPHQFQSPVDFRPRARVPFEDIVQLISSSSGFRVHVRSDVYSGNEGDSQDSGNEPVQIIANSGNGSGASRLTIDGVSYTGNLEGFLNFVTSSLNLVWSYNSDENEILISRFITNDYRLMTTPRTIDSSGSVGANEIWQQTTTTVQNFLSPGGSISANSDLGLITVTDTRDVQDQVARYVRRLNQTLAKNIQLKFESLTVRVNEDQMDGLMARLNAGNDNVQGQLFSQELISSGGGASFSVINPSRILGGSEIVANRLRGMASADQRRTQILRTQNNHPVHFNDLEVTQYLGQISRPDVSEDSAGSIAQSGGSLSLSELETGYRLSVIPHISDDMSNVVLDVWLEQSQLRRLRDESSGGERVQAPEYVTRTYNERLVVPNGSTGVVAAQEIMLSSRDDQGVLTGALSWLGGMKQRQMTREITLILVTPVINSSNIVEQVF